MAKANTTIDLCLDLEGDAIIHVEDPKTDSPKSFLVTSRVLRLASPVFQSLFKPCFSEGSQTRPGDCPVISLKDDDPAAMTLLLSVLHSQTSDTPELIEPKDLAFLAKVSDKYNCIRALRPWISQWCGFSPILNPEDFGYMLLSSYLFHSDRFTDIAMAAVKHLRPDFASSWNHEIMGMLPRKFHGSTPMNDLILCKPC